MYFRSNDGSTLLITSSDGFCSCLTFTPSELGNIHHAPAVSKHTPSVINTTTASSAVSTPSQTPTQPTIPHASRPGSSQGQHGSHTMAVPSPSPFTLPYPGPASPARSMSASSANTQTSRIPYPDQNADINEIINDPTPQMSSVPSITAASPTISSVGGMPMYTPPQTPGYTAALPSTLSQGEIATVNTLKRENEGTDSGSKDKRRRIQPTLLTEPGASGPSPSSGAGGEPTTESNGLN
jgi:chromatin assembly factor 1 subunit B